MSMVVEELLQHIQHSSHLSENQHSVASNLQLSQEGVESLELTCKQKYCKRETAEKSENNTPNDKVL